MTRPTDASDASDANLSAPRDSGSVPPQKRFRRSRRVLTGLLIGLVTLFALALLTPFLVSQSQHISAGADFVQAHPVGFALVRLTVYAAVVFYWPAVIRWRTRHWNNVSPDVLAALRHRGRPIRLLVVFELLTSGLPLLMNL